MEGEVILTGFALFGFGLLFIYLGIVGWKHRREERISLIEAAILKAGNAEPLPRNRWDRMMAYVQPVLMLMLGPLMAVAGLAILLV